jgi:hypothetical protein
LSEERGTASAVFLKMAKKPVKAKDPKVLEKGHAAGQLEGLYRATEKPAGRKPASKPQTPKG